MLSFEDLKKAAHDERRHQMLQDFKNHPLTKFGVAVGLSIAVRVTAEAITDKIGERKDKKKELED